MYASLLENMQKCYERFVFGDWSEKRSSIRVLDVGGENVKGSYADIFSESKFDYVAADMQPTPGVRVVLEDPYKRFYEDESFDLVISGSIGASSGSGTKWIAVLFLLFARCRSTQL